MKMGLTDACTICDELSGAKDTAFSRALGDDRISNAVLAVSEHFAIVPSIGPLVLGHSLVISRRHSNNIIAGAPSPQLSELRTMCENSMDILLQGDPALQLFCFEHGSLLPTEQHLCSTEHGHLHLVPLAKEEISRLIDAIGGRGFEADNFQQICNSTSALRQYIAAFCLQPKRKGFYGVVMDAAGLPSQYLRKAIARQLGTPAWDWKREVNRELLRKTIELGFEFNVQVEVPTSVS
jgi:hypothetical protein